MRDNVAEATVAYATLTNEDSMLTLTVNPSTTTESYPIKLNQKLQEPDQASFFKQCYQALKVRFEQGKVLGIAETGFFVGAFSYTGLSAVWELLGSAYSFKEIYDADHIIGRELGDVGGWTALAFFDILALKYFLDRSIAEANFFGLKAICQEFLKEGMIQPETCYKLIVKRLEDLNARGLFQKSVISRILIALELVGDPDPEKHDVSSEDYQQWVCDAELKPVYLQIVSDYEKNARLSRYFQRCVEGIKVIGEAEGLRGRVVSIGMGALLPLCLLASVVCSLIGEVKLGQLVIGQKEDLPAYGHLGEWLSNIVQAIGVASYINNKYMLNYGDCSIMGQLIKNALTQVQDNPLHYNRLCDLGVKEQKERDHKSIDFVELKLKNSPPLGVQLV